MFLLGVRVEVICIEQVTVSGNSGKRPLFTHPGTSQRHGLQPHLVATKKRKLLLAFILSNCIQIIVQMSHILPNCFFYLCYF